MLILYQFEVSPFCDKVRRVLHWKRKRYEAREVQPSGLLVRLRRSNPAGKVPVLQHGDRIVTDPGEIARYLDQTFPDPPLWPDDPRDRALCHFLEDWADESLYFFQLWFRFGPSGNAGDWSNRAAESEPPLVRRAVRSALPTYMRNVLRNQGLGRRPPEEVLSDFREHLAQLAAWLGDRDWLVGSRLSIADIAVYAQLACAGETGEGAASIGEHASLLAWMERVAGATAAPA